ncbi:dehydrogenase [Candidatus Parcubacteria bacterium]|jgi:predicted dehydrogenase/threonine dehydrogenase-like Zn-dependent dehydrogenase|nr:MAG: dehydrogenase [Candidatus Parcubacteria bacterium]
MLQILQNLKNGDTEIVDVPRPQLRHGHNLIQSSCSLISAGTERMLIDFGRAGFIGKARQQPDKVCMVLDKIRTDGLLSTLVAVRSKLDQALPMGYCNVGTVIECNEKESGFKCGDRVISNGHHAELVTVPYNLCAKIPDNISDEAAVFTVVGAIGLQGIRLAAPTLGETFVVTGLGLIGLMAVQLLKAHGCRILGVDFDSQKCELARGFGAVAVDLSKGEDPVIVARNFSRGRGVDGVLITASTKSNEPVHQAAQMCRKRGRIVLVGVVGLQLSRADFFEKELSFQVSCSYGPGRHDPQYEEKGQDYPFGYVRWTEQRNFEAVLDMMASGRLDVEPLISHRYAFENAQKAYEKLNEDRSSLGILLQYEKRQDNKKNLQLQKRGTVHPSCPKEPVLGFVGAGNYATQILIPTFKNAGGALLSIASRGGVSGVQAGRKYGFSETTTDTEGLIADPRINTVIISTRHNSHAELVCRGLRAGKHIFVEKPLCLTCDELTEIENVYLASKSLFSPVTVQNQEMENTLCASQQPLLMVGFNRRFAPQIQKMKTLLDGLNEPKSFVMQVNAGVIPEDHWTQDPTVGGGRIVGEACHFIDLLRFLVGSSIESSSIVKLRKGVGDTCSIMLHFGDGSIGTIHYFANGNKKIPKERLEVFAAGRILQLDNFLMLRGFGWPGFKKMGLWHQDKGQAACVASFVDAIRNGKPSPIQFDEIFEVSRVSIELQQL